VKRGEERQALEALAAAVKKDPKLPPAKLMLARILLAAGKSPRGRVVLEEAVVEGPRHPGGYVLFGNIALAEGRLTDAQLQYEKAQSLTSAATLSEPQKREMLTQSAAGLAAVAERRHDWASARTALTARLALDPADARARQRLARAPVQPRAAGGGVTAVGTGRQIRLLAGTARDHPGLAPQRARQNDPGRPFHEGRRRPRPGESPAASRPGHLAAPAGTHREALAPIEAAAKPDPKSIRVKLMQGVIAHRLKDHEAAEQPPPGGPPGDARGLRRQQRAGPGARRAAGPGPTSPGPATRRRTPGSIPTSRKPLRRWDGPTSSLGRMDDAPAAPCRPAAPADGRRPTRLITSAGPSPRGRTR
ncbi:MAG: tetratricopeptide repeat protein, partial [Singulisphaera sp.]